MLGQEAHTGASDANVVSLPTMFEVDGPLSPVRIIIEVPSDMGIAQEGTGPIGIE